MGRPPTIGSRPSKLPTSPMSDLTIDGELMASKSRGSIQLAASAAAQVWRDKERDVRDGNRNRDSMGYLELDDDAWVVDVELAEGIRRKKDKKIGSEGRDDGTKVGVEREKETGSSLHIKHHQSTTRGLDSAGMGTGGVGAVKKDSTRSNDSDGTTLEPATDLETQTGTGADTMVPKLEEPRVLGPDW